MDWERIVTEGRRLAHLIPQDRVNPSESEAGLEYYISTGFNDEKLAKFLDLMISNPPRRSRRTRGYYENLKRALLHTWNTSLTGEEKAMAWGWAIRTVKSA